MGTLKAAEAQDVGEDETLARGEFQECLSALERDQPEEAIRHCRASLSLLPNAPAAYNLGLALKRIGQPAEAQEVFQQLVDGEFGSLDTTQRREVEAQLAAVRAQLVTIEVTVRGGDGAVSIGMDERQVQAGETERFADLNPGAHEVVFENADGIQRRDVRVVQGAQEIVFVAQGPGRPENEGEGSGWVVPLLIVAGVVAAIALGTTIAVLATSGGENDDALRDDVFGVTFALE
ncbi:MAG: hypothetical protein AAGF12_06925 [Myxococcota bacterium]